MQTMSIEEIKDQIRLLSEEERRKLRVWLDEQVEEDWDLEMERDFAPGRWGSHLAAILDREIGEATASGALTSREEGLRIRLPQARALFYG